MQRPRAIIEAAISEMTRRYKTAIFRHTLLPLSETFISEQVRHLRGVDVVVLGIRFQNSDRFELPAGHVINPGRYARRADARNPLHHHRTFSDSGHGDRRGKDRSASCALRRRRSLCTPLCAPTRAAADYHLLGIRRHHESQEAPLVGEAGVDSLRLVCRASPAPRNLVHRGLRISPQSADTERLPSRSDHRPLQRSRSDRLRSRGTRLRQSDDIVSRTIGREEGHRVSDQGLRSRRRRGTGGAAGDCGRGSAAAVTGAIDLPARAL